MTMTPKQTDWTKVARGTPLLFRRDRNTEYEEGTWLRCVPRMGKSVPAFSWSLMCELGEIYRGTGDKVIETGECHIKPFWVKLKTESGE